SFSGAHGTSVTRRWYGWMVTDWGVVTTARKRGSPPVWAARLRWLPSATTSSPALASAHSSSAVGPGGSAQISWVRPAWSTSRVAGGPAASQAATSASCSALPLSPPDCSSSTGESRCPVASASATRSRTLSRNTSSLRITSPGSSARVEIWSVSTIANIPYEGGSPLMRYSTTTCSAGVYAPAALASASRLTAAGSASVKLAPSDSG